MKLLKLGTNLAKVGSVAKSISPELCLAGSILFGIGCVVTSCMATVKSEKPVREAVEQIETVRKANENEDAPIRSMKDLSKAEKKAVNDIRMGLGLVLAKNYAVPAILGVASIALNIGGHYILRKSLAATTIALAAKIKEMDEYRKRVIADQGAEKDQEYMHGLKAEKQVEVDPETGEVVSEKTVYKQTMPGISQYARMFDEGDWDDVNKRWIHKNERWVDDPWKNQVNLRSIEREMNQKLVIDGFLFLNDVYRRLGLPLSIDGQIVGWVYGSNNGDHAVSFGVFEDDPRQLPCNKAFIEGKTPNAMLDFNVDGPIINDLENFFGEELTRKLIAYRS